MSAPEGFTDYVLARRPALVGTAYLLCGDLQLAEDLVREALVGAASHWRRIGDDPEPWLLTALVRGCPSRPAEQPAAHGLLDALATLTPRQRAVVVLREHQGLSDDETAEVLGVAVGKVRSLHRDAIARLRTLLPGLAAPDASSEVLHGQRP